MENKVNSEKLKPLNNLTYHHSFNDLKSEVMIKHINFITDKINEIEKKILKKQKCIEKYEEVERFMLNYVNSPENNFNLIQRKFLKALIRQKLNEGFISTDSENRIKIVRNFDLCFKFCIDKIDDKKDIKYFFGNQFSFSNLNVEMNDIEQLSSILKAMENSVLSEFKSYICMKMNIDAIPQFLMWSHKKLVKQKVRKIWKISYEIPVNNLKMESNFGYKFLNEKFLDLINEKFNLFDEGYISKEVKLILFDLLIISNVEYILNNEYNLTTFFNNSKKYIFLMGLDSEYSEMSTRITELIKQQKNEALFEAIFIKLKENLKGEFSILNMDKEKLLIIIFSFSIMLNNLMTYNIKEEDSSDNPDDKFIIPKITFTSELKCSSRERQFLINLLNKLDSHLTHLEDFGISDNKFSSLKINYMLENSIFSSLIKSYTKVLFDEDNKVKINLDKDKIFELIQKKVCEGEDSSELLTTYEMFKSMLDEEVQLVDKANSSAMKKIKSKITGGIKSFYNMINKFRKSELDEDEDEAEINIIENNVNKKVKVDLNNMKLAPYDQINISTHICICINGDILEGEIQKIWEGFTVNEKSVDYYFFHWKGEENKSTNPFISEALSFYSKIKTKMSSEETLELNNKNSFKKNKAASKIFGKILAYILATRSVFQFHVISFIGYSLGCNVIKHCLIELHKIFDFLYDTHDIIQNVVFIGGATKLNNEKYKYEELFKIIGGRIINCYSPFDTTLADVYSSDAIGLNPLNYTKEGKAAPLIENYELSIGDHTDYRNEMGRILNNINIL